MQMKTYLHIELRELIFITSRIQYVYMSEHFKGNLMGKVIRIYSQHVSYD